MNLMFLIFLFFSTQFSRAAQPTIALVTDYGSETPRGALCKLALKQINPDFTIIDLTNNITPFSKEEAAGVLAENADFFPSNTIFLTIVDPNWGNKMTPIIVRTKKGQIFVAPDNGVLTSVLEEQEISEIRVAHKKLFKFSNDAISFGREIYCPLAGFIARGDELSSLGKEVKKYHKLVTPEVDVTEDGILGSVMFLDSTYGNAVTNISAKDISGIGIKKGKSIRVKLNDLLNIEFNWVNNFGEAKDGDPVYTFNKDEKIVLALNRRNLALKTGVKPLNQVRVYKSK